MAPAPSRHSVWAPAALLAALPATTRAIAVLDRCKEPGADGEPLFKDVLVAMWCARWFS